MISTPIATSAALEQSSKRFSSFDKRVGVRVWGDDRLHWRVKKMDYPVCHTIIHPHIYTPPHIHTVTVVILISPGITGCICGMWENTVACCRDRWFDAPLPTCCHIRQHRHVSARNIYVRRTEPVYFASRFSIQNWVYLCFPLGWNVRCATMPYQLQRPCTAQWRRTEEEVGTCLIIRTDKRKLK